MHVRGTHASPLQHPVLLQTATLLAVLLLGYGYFWLLVPDLETRLQQLGLFCSVFTISMYLSPLADLVSRGNQEVEEMRRRARLPELWSEGRGVQPLEEVKTTEVGEWNSGKG